MRTKSTVESRPVCLTLPLSYKEFLDDVAVRTGLTKSDIVRRALEIFKDSDSLISLIKKRSDDETGSRR